MGAAVRALRIHWARIAWTIAAVTSTRYAEAQISKEDRLPIRPAAIVLPDIIQPNKVVTATIVPNPALGLGRPLGEPVCCATSPAA